MAKLDKTELEEMDDELSEMKPIARLSKRSIVKTSSADTDTELDLIKNRVERFLSVVELPPEVLLLQQKFALQQERKNKKKGHKDKTDNKEKNKNKSIRNYHDGSGLCQAVRADIIREIISNFDMEKYINDFIEKNTIRVNLSKDKPEHRAVRDRLLKLMKSDVIRINDKNYMTELSKRLEENDQREQNKILDHLAEVEKKRERNLIARGLIDEPYDS